MGIQIYQGMGSLSTCSNYQRPEIKLVSGEEVRRQDQEQQQAALQQGTPDYSRMTEIAERRHPILRTFLLLLIKQTALTIWEARADWRISML